MSNLPSQTSERLTMPGDSPLTRSMLRALIDRCRLGLGSRVLDLAAAGDPLPVSLEWLGMEVTSWNPSDIGRLGRSPDFLRPQSFDLVLIRDDAAWPVNLLSREAAALTQQLVGLLRPEGTLCRTIPPAVASIHQTACWEAHLASCGAAPQRETCSSAPWYRFGRPAVKAGFLFVPCAAFEQSLTRSIPYHAHPATTCCCDRAAQRLTTSNRRAA